MAEDDNTIPPPAPPAGGGSGGGLGNWLQDHKAAAMGGGLVLLIVGYVFLKNRGSRSAATTGTASGPTGTGPAVYEIAPGTATGSGGSQSSYEQMLAYEEMLAAQASSSASSASAPANGGVASGSTKASSQNAHSGFGRITIGNRSYDVLGTVGGSGKNLTYNGYEVGGGAPVFFGNANGIAQGWGNVKPGNYIYTPTDYSNFVSSKVDHRTLA